MALICLILAALGPAAARADEPPAAAAGSGSVVAGESNPDPSRWDFAALPVVFYAPETSLGLGVGGILFGNAPATSDRPRRDDSLALFVTATLKKQFILAAASEWYLRGERFKVAAEGTSTRFPNQFWGIGNQTLDAAGDDYTRLVTAGRALFSVQALPDVFVGVGLGLSAYRVEDVEAGGTVARYLEEQPGRGSFAAAGVVIQRDSRDDTLATHRGAYTEISAIYFAPMGGNQGSFASYRWDQRQYVSLGKSVLKAQVFAALVTGEVPLDEMPALGGSARLRGYFEGRYRDRFYVMAQTECRVPLFWRLRAVPFFGVGDVFPGPRDIDLAHLKAAGGLGLRLDLKPERELNLRLDVAFARDSSGVYVNLGEAF